MSKNAVVFGLVLLSLSFIPLQSEHLGRFRVITFILSLTSFGIGLALAGWALRNDTLTKYSKALLLEVLLTSSLILITALEFYPYNVIYLLTQAAVAVTLINFLILYTYSWYLFRRTFRSARKYLFTLTSSTILVSLGTATYTLPPLIPVFVGANTSTSYEQNLTYYCLTSLIAFPALLTLSILYLTLPDF